MIRRRKLLGICAEFHTSGSIADNIRFGRPNATDEEVERAAKLANAHEFITAKPDGIRTRVQGGASNLSIGQRQLVCIARAILTDPRILIMDEATSNVDSMTESLIHDALRRLLNGRTAMVSSQRSASRNRSSTRSSSPKNNNIWACSTLSTGL